ncbi:MAG: T9SS type A sorting domain-containing protein [Bacteroidota bacterium]
MAYLIIMDTRYNFSVRKYQYPKFLSHIILLVLTMLLATANHAQTFWSEDFETDGNGTRYTPEVEALPSATNASCNDHFARNLATDGCSGDLIDISLGNYTGLSGSYLWAGEDLDDNGVGGSQNFELFITFDNIPSIAGKSNLMFRGRFGTGASSAFENFNEAPTNPDFMIVEYQIDGGGFQEVIAFYAENFGSGFSNTPLALDTDNDRIGDGAALTNALQSFTAPISGTGSTLDLRIRVSANSSTEEMAFDFFELFEAAPLPVELLSFEGEATTKGIDLHWQTLTEVNNKGFELQKLYKENEWELMGFIEGQGNSSTLQDYYFEDHTAVAGTNYYRLKQVDFDDRVEYSKVLAVTFQPALNTLNVFPNPTQQNVNVIFKPDNLKEGQIEVFDELGRRLIQQRILTGASQLEIALPSVGIYWLRIQLNGGVQHHKIIVQ